MSTFDALMVVVGDDWSDGWMDELPAPLMSGNPAVGLRRADVAYADNVARTQLDLSRS